VKQTVVRVTVFYSKVWFNTPELAPVQITCCFQKFGIKPDGIINNHRLKAVGFVAAESRFEAKAS
jgi:hypothetical protein